MRLRPPSVELVLDSIERRCAIMHVSETCWSNFCNSRLGPGGWRSKWAANEIGVGVGGGTWTVVPQDAAVSGYKELTVAGVEKVVIRDACRHALKVVDLRVERAERTGITWRRRVVSNSTLVGLCVYRHSKLESRAHCPRDLRRWRLSVVTKCVRKYFVHKLTWYSVTFKRVIHEAWMLSVLFVLPRNQYIMPSCPAHLVQFPIVAPSCVFRNL